VIPGPQSEATEIGNAAEPELVRRVEGGPGHLSWREE
jgi:hypothetical protein